MSIRAVLTDIEGTTSAIAFVKDTLFPYARAHLPQFVAKHGDDAVVCGHLDAARREAGLADDADVVPQLIRWIDEDRKVTPLKALQGLIWQRGYESGELTGHIHADAVDSLRRWHAQGLQLYVYSSGSVAAQKLLFAHTGWGDLTPLFSGYFDTMIGSKLEAPSYARIVEQIGLPASDILFLSDNVLELEAAAEAGMRTGCLDRGEVAMPEGHAHPVFKDFSGIEP